MKSRISFFNVGLFKKDITRFTPLWALYTVGLLLTLFSWAWDSSFLGKYLGDSIGPFGVVNLISGFIAAQLLFGDLFQSQLCNAMHAMPMRRETRFFTHLLAGLSFSLVPNLLATLISLAFLGEYWFLAPMWLLGVTLSYLVFFGIGVFSILCTGSRFAATVVYAIVNFGSWVAYWFADTIYLPMMRGVELNDQVFGWFSPVSTIASGEFMNFSIYRYAKYVYTFTGYGDGWLYLSIAAVIGVALLGCALVLYRRRSLESAGDFMAVRWLRPVFLLTYTLCIGAFLAMFGEIINDVYLIFLFIGIICGFFTGYMLLDRTIRVFRKRRFLQLAILLVAMGLSIFVTKVDLLGVVRWVPEAEKVESVQVEGGGETLLITDPETLDAVLSAHEAFLKEDDEYSGTYANIWLTYTLKSGRVVTRHYAVLSTTPELTTLKKLLFSSPEVVFDLTGNWESYRQGVTCITYENEKGSSVSFYDQEQILSLLDALYADCLAGDLAQSWAFHSETADYAGHLTLFGSGYPVYITVYSDTENTLNVLSALTAK